MNTKHGFVGFLFLMVIAATSVTAVLTPDPQPVVAIPEAAAPAATPDGACGALEPGQPADTAGACCKSQCWTDKQCDSICGKGNGACVWVNSCCRECACFS